MNTPSPVPRVILSWAQSADGRIATRTGDSKYLSSPESLEIQQELRRDCDGVLVGIGTVLADDPRLLCRLGGDKNPHARQPLRVVLDSHFQTPLHSTLATTARDYPVLVIGAHTETTGPDAINRSKRRSALEGMGISTATVPIASEATPIASGTTPIAPESTPIAPGATRPYQRLDLRAVLTILRQRGVETLFVEGGAGILTAFLADNLADRIILDISPRFIGDGIQAIGNLGTERLANSRLFKTQRVEQRGANVVWTLER